MASTFSFSPFLSFSNDIFVNIEYKKKDAKVITDNGEKDDNGNSISFQCVFTQARVCVCVLPLLHKKENNNLTDEGNWNRIKKKEIFDNKDEYTRKKNHKYKAWGMFKI